MGLSTSQLAKQVGRLGYELPESITDADRGWMFELLNSCARCGHQTRLGNCPICFEYALHRPYDERGPAEDDYGEESHP